MAPLSPALADDRLPSARDLLTNRAVRKAFDILILIVATGAGVGWTPLFPGTVGSFWGILIACGLDYAEVGLPASCLLLSGLVAIGIPICTRAARLLQRPDPAAVVYDEYVSLPIAVLFVPMTPVNLMIGFVSFRLFDITKPWPIRRMERLPEGWGIMADDVLAALMASIVTWGTQVLFF